MSFMTKWVTPSQDTDKLMGLMHELTTQRCEVSEDSTTAREICSIPETSKSDCCFMISV